MNVASMIFKFKIHILRFGYRQILKRIFFCFDPEHVHDRMIGVGKKLGQHAVGRKACAALFSYSHPILEQTILGIHFQNPIGLAAGFDKNAELTDILPSVGFGFEEMGSVTGKPCNGNPKPRLWRLKKSKGLVVYYGLKSDGCEAIAKRLGEKFFQFPVGISIAKTNCIETVDKKNGIADYVKAFRMLNNFGHYITLNISCPNAFGGQPFTRPDDLHDLLTAIEKIQNQKPIFIKLPPDFSEHECDALLNVCDKHHISGFVCTNLTKDRQNPNVQKHLKDSDIPLVGGISGKPVQEISTAMIKTIYRKTNGNYIIIGCGGIFNAKDAYEKIKAGASLLQLITGMIFEGPQVISEINQGLVQLLHNDGYKHLSEAIGSSARQ